MYWASPAQESFSGSASFMKQALALAEASCEIITEVEIRHLVTDCFFLGPVLGLKGCAEYSGELQVYESQ